MAEKWRRCGDCRKVKSIDEFSGDEPNCEGCRQAAVQVSAKAAARAVRNSSQSGAVADNGGGSTVTVTRAVATPIRDLTGRGDAEIRARRARVKALERLVELHPQDFAALLAEERSTERL